MSWATTPSSYETPARLAGDTIASSSWATDIAEIANVPSADPRPDVVVLQWSVEQVGADGDDDPDVERFIGDHPREGREEFVASLGCVPRPALLELVDHDDHTADPTGDAPHHAPPTSSTTERLVGDLVEGRSQRRRWVVSGHQHHHRASAGPQPRHDAGTDHRALPRTARADDGNQPSLLDELDQLCSTTSARPWKLFGVGFVERQQSFVRIDPCHRRPGELHSRSPTGRIDDAAVVGPHRRHGTVRSADGEPPRQDQLGDRRVATFLGGRPGDHGTESGRSVGDAADEARRPRLDRSWATATRRPVSSSQSSQPKSHTSSPTAAARRRPRWRCRSRSGRRRRHRRAARWKP